MLGLIGSLKHRYKGITTVLEALGKVRTQLPPLVFRVLGGGDSRPWRAEAVRNGVNHITFFDGTLPAGEEVLRWLDGVDIYLQPSFQEGLPRALIEAMSRGCPALASTCGGIPELLEAESLVKPGDAAHLARLLIMATTNRDWQSSQARRNWTSSKEYDCNLLAARRHAFWAHFAVQVRNRARR